MWHFGSVKSLGIYNYEVRHARRLFWNECKCYCWTCVTYWNYKGFFSVWWDLLSFPVPGWTEKIAGLWFAGRDQYLGWYYGHSNGVQLFQYEWDKWAIIGSWHKNRWEIELTFFPCGKKTIRYVQRKSRIKAFSYTFLLIKKDYIASFFSYFQEMFSRKYYSLVLK